ncbi:MAG: elongation factor P [Candidatus Levybacteria bacterium]|nr:elongation factor P [Candidatus Levybacteria bacterium]MBI2420637.1 elongation factor P [Candidatus Levybacteria bacterium]
MIGVTELRSGTIFEESGNLFQVLSYEHIKMGRGSANIKVKVKNLKNGSTTEKSFINGARVNEVNVFKRDVQFLYKDKEFAYFMDPSSFEQIAVSLKIIGSNHSYLKEGYSFNVSFLGETAFSLNLPPKMDLKVIETDAGVKGNSATNIFKDAVLENGMKTKVPLFIKEGEMVKIDTRTGEYTAKA